MFNVSPEDKEKVLKKSEHEMLVHNKPVTIVLETTKKPVEDLRPRLPSLTQPAETPSSRPPSLTGSLDEALCDDIHPQDGLVSNSVDSVVQKVSVDRGADAALASAPPFPSVFSGSLVHPGLYREE